MEVPMHAMHVQAGSCSELSWPGRMEEPFQAMAVQELLGGAFLRLDDGDPEGALSCALQALCLSAGPTAMAAAAWRASQRESALQVCREILQRGGILVDRGHGQILKKTLEDGSSVVCTKCGALVASSRAEAHRSFWCPSLQNDKDDEAGDPVLRCEAVRADPDSMQLD
mmetsp:Transcript_4323/g.9291  ORF Transcript_4323/g.9291 Transcript_4323/m.9291 type:complete len:169 (-) Transcript_4323:217-723(-)|eukprot:s3420_g6.t1